VAGLLAVAALAASLVVSGAVQAAALVSETEVGTAAAVDHLLSALGGRTDVGRR